MPTLLEDLVKETSASNRRVADRLHAELRILDDRRHAVTMLEDLRQLTAESTRQATDGAVSRLPQAEGVWRMALVELIKKPIGEHAVRLLHGLLEVFESGKKLIHLARSLWKIAEQMGIDPDRFDELDQAERHFEELAAEVKRALEYRTRAWQPTDPERLTLGIQLAREGRTVKEDEARTWFSRDRS